MKIQTNQKPTSYDLHLKYICLECGDTHWLSFRETSTKNFKVVCDCGNTFKVKRTKSLKIKYHKKSNKTKTVDSTTAKDIPVDLLKAGVRTIVPYGFTSEEASELLKTSYASNPTKDLALLIKQSLASLRK